MSSSLAQLRTFLGLCVHFSGAVKQKFRDAADSKSAVVEALFPEDEVIR